MTQPVLLTLTHINGQLTLHETPHVGIEHSSRRGRSYNAQSLLLLPRYHNAASSTRQRFPLSFIMLTMAHHLTDRHYYTYISDYRIVTQKSLQFCKPNTWCSLTHISLQLLPISTIRLYHFSTLPPLRYLRLSRYRYTMT